jgi:hypothetical protein
MPYERPTIENHEEKQRCAFALYLSNLTWFFPMVRGIRRGVSNGVEDGYRLPALCQAVSGVAACMAWWAASGRLEPLWIPRADARRKPLVCLTATKRRQIRAKTNNSEKDVKKDKNKLLRILKIDQRNAK